MDHRNGYCHQSPSASQPHSGPSCTPLGFEPKREPKPGAGTSPACSQVFQHQHEGGLQENPVLYGDGHAVLQEEPMVGNM
mmetsp:Transcript_38148/g.59024  ORF Transcript_38148/g.59024 Transcript_38148/m.59024 type:complete len:80 (-) Transcript_38148:691-930(-)